MNCYLYTVLTGWYRKPTQVQYYEGKATPIWYGRLEHGKITCLEIRMHFCNIEDLLNDVNQE